MRTIQILVAIGVCAIFVPIYGCSCRSTSTCEAFGAAKAVFIGQVVSGASPERMSDAFALKTNQIEFVFDVKTAYTGADPAKNISIYTGLGFGDCGFPFEKGETYLVFAYESEGKLKTGICSGSRHYSRISDDQWDFLKSVSKGKWDGGKIFGNVSIIKQRKEVDFNTVEVTEPAANAPLKLIAGNDARKIQTDSNGNYAVTGLVATRYRLELEPTDNYLLDRQTYVMYSGQQNWEPREVELSQGGCSEENFRLINDSSISGRLVGLDGKPLDKATVQLIPVNSPDRLDLEEVYEAETNQKGEYTVRGVPVGTYVLGINLSKSPDQAQPYRRTYYPGSLERKNARVIQVGTGAKITLIDLRLTEKLKPQTVSGVVVFENGKPASEVSVTLEDVNRPHVCVNGCDNRTDSKGRFKLTGYEGFRYFVVAYDSSDEYDRYDQSTISTPTNFELKGPLNGLKLVLVKKPKADGYTPIEREPK